MAGTFSKSARPKRPGAYFNFTARESEPVLRNTLGTVVVPFTHTWGPSDTLVELDQFGDFLSVYGQGGTTPPAYTPGYMAVEQAFQGEGLPGRGGAGVVLGYRFTGTGAAKATRALGNVTPAATALSLTARYEGTYGNNITVQTQDKAGASTYTELIIFVETREVERYTFLDADIAGAAAQINASSSWVTAVANINGVALTAIGPVALTGGNDGGVPAAGDWTAFMAACEAQRFSLLAAYDLTDPTILASLVSWSQTLNSRGHRFMTVVGGGTVGTPDTVALATTRSATINDPNFVNIGGGVYTDARLGDLTPAQLTSRVAGILASRGETESLTFARLAGLSIKVGPTESEILSALDNGVVTFARDSHPDAPVRIEKGLTAFINKADAQRPFSIYSVPKFVRTMHSIETELTEFAEMNVIGRLPVNTATRAYIVGATQARMAAREALGVIQPGWSVTVDGDPPPQDTDDFIALLYSVKFGRSLEQVLNTVVVG